MRPPPTNLLPVSTFTFTVRLDQEGWEGLEMTCAGDAQAIETAREVLQAKIDFRPLLAGRARTGTAGVGLGSLIDEPERLVWLGEWEWSAADGFSWTPSA